MIRAILSAVLLIITAAAATAHDRYRIRAYPVVTHTHYM